MFDLSEFTREREAEPAPRRTVIVLGVAGCLMLGGFVYFFRVLLAFKTSILNNATAVLAPYPAGVIIYAIIPLFAGLYYLALEQFRLQTGLSLLKTPQGLGASVGVALLLLLASTLPGKLLRQFDDHFATSHGFIRCASPFDPDHVHVYAMQSYVAAFGCPTVTLPQD